MTKRYSYLGSKGERWQHQGSGPKYVTVALTTLQQCRITSELTVVLIVLIAAGVPYRGPQPLSVG